VANDSIAAPAAEVHAMSAVVKGKVRIGSVASAGPAGGNGGARCCVIFRY